MRRLSAQLLFFGIAGWVLALGKVHASLSGDYDFSESSRYGSIVRMEGR